MGSDPLMAAAPSQPDWPAWRFEATATRSLVVHGNRLVLPVASWILEAGVRDVTASEVVKGLNGQLAPNKALDALARISEIGALEELPHPGRPNPRIFRRRAAAYWSFVAEDLAPLIRDPSSKDA